MENNDQISGDEKISQAKIKIEFQIAEINALLNLQLNEILHHEDFQRLEASWRGLHYFVNETKPNQHLKIKIFQAAKRDLLKDFERALEFNQSNVFKRVYEDVYNTFGENPFGMLIGAYEFANHPQDMALLEHISIVAAAAHAPFISSLSPDMFGWEDFSEMYATRSIEAIFDRTEYMKWRSIRESQDSLYVGLCLPHILLREPYSQVSGGLFNESATPETLLWGNAAFAFGACVAKAYRESSWCGMIRGAESDGLVEGLASYEINGFNQSIDFLIDEQKEKELSTLGFIPLIQNLATNETAFFSDQSCNKVRKYDYEEANRNSRATSQIPYTLAKSRFAHYLKVIVRDRAQPFANQEDCQWELNRWLNQYVHYDLTRYRYPLKSSRIDIVKLPNKPGEFRGVAFLSPVYLIDELSVGQRIVFDLPKNHRNLTNSKLNSITLTKISNRLFVSDLSDKFLRENKKFYLAIRSALPENELLKDVHRLVKISSPKTIGKVLHFSLPGITLNHVLPSNLNVLDSSFHYFSLGTIHNPYWGFVNEEKRITVNAATDLEILEIKLLGDQSNSTPETIESVDYFGLNLLDEPSLIVRDAGSNVHSYRFYWGPNSAETRLFRVNIESNQIGNIVVKGYNIDFRGGQFNVHWIQNDTFQLSAEEVKWWLKVVERSSFWEMKGEQIRRGRMEGSFWTIEGLKDGHYHEIFRLTPQELDIRELGLAFLKLGRYKIDESCFF